MLKSITIQLTKFIDTTKVNSVYRTDKRLFNEIMEYYLSLFILMFEEYDYINVHKEKIMIRQPRFPFILIFEIRQYDTGTYIKLNVYKFNKEVFQVKKYI